MSYNNIQRSGSSFVLRYFHDLVAYRHLAWNLAGADLRSRFRRSYLGILWAVIQPLGFSIILGWVWGGLFDYPSIWDYSLYIYAGLVVWEYFTTVVNISQDSLVSAEGYLKQTRIPFLIFQARTVLTGMVVALTASIGLFGMLLVLGKLPPLGPHLVLIPLNYLVMLVFFTPLAIIMSILGTQLRDLKHGTMLLMQALFFISPVMLNRTALTPDKLAVVNKVNPAAELINMFRAPIIDGTFWTAEQMVTVATWAAVFWFLALVTAIRTGRGVVFSL